MKDYCSEGRGSDSWEHIIEKASGARKSSCKAIHQMKEVGERWEGVMGNGGECSKRKPERCAWAGWLQGSMMLLYKVRKGPSPGQYSPPLHPSPLHFLELRGRLWEQKDVFLVPHHICHQTQHRAQCIPSFSGVFLYYTQTATVCGSPILRPGQERLYVSTQGLGFYCENNMELEGGGLSTGVQGHSWIQQQIYWNWGLETREHQC